MEDGVRAPFMLEDAEAPRARRCPQLPLRQVVGGCLLLMLGLLMGRAVSAESRGAEGSRPSLRAQLAPAVANVSAALQEMQKSMDRLSFELNFSRKRAPSTATASSESYDYFPVCSGPRGSSDSGQYPQTPCSPPGCARGDVDFGTKCYLLSCRRTCRSNQSTAANGGYSDSRQNAVTCSDDFTGHAGDQRRVVSTSLEWTASSSHYTSVDLWGGGGGGTGSAVKEQEEAGIIEVTVNFRPNYFGSASRTYHPNGLYFRDEDSAGNVRYVRSDDVYHLSRQEDCRVSPQKVAFPCWKLALNSEYFHVTPLAMLEWPSDELPLGDRTWVIMDTLDAQPFAQPFQDVANISLKSARKSYGICGGSGGAGAHVRALVKVKAGRTYRIEAGRGGKGSSGGRSASNGQSSRMLEMQASGEWSILAEAGGGFGAGSMEGRLKFSPGGRGGTAPKLDSHVFARPGHPGWSSRASLLTEDTILFPMAMLPLRGRPWMADGAGKRDVPPKGQLPQRLFPPGFP